MSDTDIANDNKIYQTKAKCQGRESCYAQDLKTPLAKYQLSDFLN